MKNIFKNYQSVFSGIAIAAVMLSAAYLLGLSSLGAPNHQSIIYALNMWFKQHKFVVILWHVLIIIAIYWGWGIKVDLLSKQHELSQETINKYKRFRWILIITIVTMDLMVHY